MFDGVVSTWVLEHLKDPQVFFCEAYRVVNDGGFLGVTVPFIQHQHGSPFDYWRFTDTALFHLSRSAGFKDVEVKKVGGTPFLCVIALLWPFFRIPVLGVSMALVALSMDYIVVKVTHFLKKGVQLVESYPISYVVYARKERKNEGCVLSRTRR